MKKSQSFFDVYLVNQLRFFQIFVAFSEKLNFTKMGAERLTENTPNAQKCSAQFVSCPSPKNGIFEKSSRWVSIVRGKVYRKKLHHWLLRLWLKIDHIPNSYSNFFFLFFYRACLSEAFCRFSISSVKLLIVLNYELHTILYT